MKAQLLAIVTAVGVVFACTSMTKVNNPESQDFPCGPQGLVCSGTYPNAMCCWEGDVCGGTDGTCAKGYCCFVGDEKMSTKRNGRAKQYAQWSAVRRD